MRAGVRDARAPAGSVRDLRVIGVTLLILGAAASLAFMLYAGHRVHAPSSLLVLFAGWVLAPFALLAMGAASARWSMSAMYMQMIGLAVLSVPIYGMTALGARRPITAVFVLVPPASTLLTMIVTVVSARRNNRQER